MRPFDMESWIMTGLMTIICTIALGLTFKAEFVKDKLDTWSEAVVVITSIICQQGLRKIEAQNYVTDAET